MNFRDFNKIYSKAFDDGVLDKEPQKMNNSMVKKIYNQGYEDGKVSVKVNPDFIKVVKH